LIINTNTDLGELLDYTRNYDAAIEQLHRTLKMDPSFILARQLLGVSYVWKGLLPEAATELSTVSKSAGNRGFLPTLGMAFAKSGKIAQAKAIEHEVEGSLKPGAVRLYTLVCLYATLGEKNKAFAVLEEAYKERQGSLILVKVDPALDPLRSEPRFAKLVQKVGL